MQKLFTRRNAAVFMAIMILITSAFCTGVYAQWPIDTDLTEQISTSSYSVFMVDEDFTHVFYEKNIHEKIYPASTIKILTALLAVENCSLDEVVTVSEKAIALPPDYTCMPLFAGEKIRLREVLYGLMVRSANDCANAIAEHVAGSIPKFVEMMNERAKALGCRESHFTNPYGLYDEDHYSSAYDMALITRAALNNAIVAEMAHTREYHFKKTNKSPEREWSNGNGLYDPESYFYNSHVIASKAGNLDTGRCLVSLFRYGAKKIITICMQSQTGAGIHEDTKKLMDFLENNIIRHKPELFSDVQDPKTDFFTPVYWASANNIANGFEDNSFRPEETVSRQQFALMLWRMAGKPEVNTEKESETSEDPEPVGFTDIDSSSPSYMAVKWLENTGIRPDNEAGFFYPEDPLTRADAVYFIWSVLGWPPSDTVPPFNDIEGTDHYTALCWAYEAGLINGLPDSSFSPDDNCSRSQAVTILYRLSQSGLF